MYKVSFRFKPFTITFDDVQDCGDFWSCRFFDSWQNFDKSLIKSVNKI